MTDLETIQALIAKLGPRDGYPKIETVVSPTRDPRIILTVEAKTGERIDGYTGFVVVFVFDEDSQELVRMGIWE